MSGSATVAAVHGWCHRPTPAATEQLNTAAHSQQRTVCSLRKGSMSGSATVGWLPMRQPSWAVVMPRLCRGGKATQN